MNSGSNNNKQMRGKSNIPSRGRKSNIPTAPSFRVPSGSVNQNRRRKPRPKREARDGTGPNLGQIGTVVRTRLTRTGISDIRRLRIAAVIGFTYVGNGTNGTANSVYFLTASQTWLIQGLTANSSGQVPVALADTDVGQAYVKDVEKHFVRKVIRRMWLHVDSLQPSTSNNMMAIIGFSRGPGGMARSIPKALATASVTANTVANLASMRGSFPIDSWEHKSIEITEFIASGSGSSQNEFEIIPAPNLGGTSQAIYVTDGTQPTVDGEGLIPACIAVAGNSTTAGLQGTIVHQITIEQEIDLIDYVGGMADPAAVS